MKRIVFALTLIAFVSGCAFVTVKESYSGRRDKVKVGMSKAEFKKLFPEAVVKEVRLSLSGSNTEALEVVDEFYSVVDTGNKNRDPKTGMQKEIKWFYFYKDALVQFDEPNNWPNNPEKILNNK